MEKTKGEGEAPPFVSARLLADGIQLRNYAAEKEENRKKKRFLLGESMGGAVALLLHRKKLSLWNGAVLVAPMCKVTFLSFISSFTIQSS